MRLVVDALNAGALAPLGPGGLPSGIAKTAQPGPWQVTRTGLAGDHQGDTRHHGGPEKALHHYPREHYRAWAAEDPASGPFVDQAPMFGENVSTTGATERDIHVGDVFAFGPALLQVSQGRQPCWRLNARTGRSDMARRVQASGRTGWYYRVLRPGLVEPGAALVLAARPQPAWPLARIAGILYDGQGGPADWAALAALPDLAESWRGLFARRLDTGRIEDWSRRLDGEAARA